MVDMFLIEQRPPPPLWSGSTSERACAYCKLGYSRFPGVIVFCFVAGDGACNASVSPTDRLSVCQSAIDASRSLTSLCLCALIVEYCAKCVAICCDTRKLFGSDRDLRVSCSFSETSCESGTKTQPYEMRYIFVKRNPSARGWSLVLRQPGWNTAELCLNSYSSPFWD